jgi:hypothetical protein
MSALQPNILAARAILRRAGNQTQYSLVMTDFDFEPRFDSSSMIFGSLRFRRTPVNLFCNAFGKSPDLSGRLASRGAETPASRREEDSEPTRDRCFANLLKRRAVGELFTVDPNGMASAAAEGCLTREPF